MNIENLSTTSSLRLRFDQLSPECDDDTDKHLLWWGRRMSVPPFVSHKLVSWFDNGLCYHNHQKPIVMFKGCKVLKKVDDVKMMDRYNSKNPSIGTLYLTATHLIFVDPDINKETWIMLTHIGSIDKLPLTTSGSPLLIRCKNFLTVTFVVPKERECHDVYTTLLKLCQPVHIKNLYCFQYTSSSEDLAKSAGWEFFKLENEYKRMRVPNDKWTLCSLNQNYELCDTYPRQIYVPAEASTAMLMGSSRFRSKGRLPALTYLHTNKASICRCSQPLSGFSARCLEDEQMLEAIRNTNPNSDYMYVVDTRPRINAMANRAAGKGYENEAFYENIKFQFLGIENIHVMRSSLQKLMEISSEQKSLTMSGFLGSLESSGWLKHIRAILDTSHFIANAVDKGISVVVHCSDGWDRTAQVCAVAALMLDPFYRTIKGFQGLIEKDWLAFGHKFSDRCGFIQGDPKEMSPVFTQFLDCTFQMMQQRVDAFEFNEGFLLTLHDHVQSCQFGTFIGNCEKDRLDLRLSESTFSLWGYMANHLNEYINPLYRPEMDEIIRPNLAPQSIKFWRGMYGRFESGVHPREPLGDLLLSSRDHCTSLEDHVHHLTKPNKSETKEVTHEKDLSLACELCSNTFVNAYSLARHKKGRCRATKVVDRNCPICTKYIPKKSHRDRHIDSCRKKHGKLFPKKRKIEEHNGSLVDVETEFVPNKQSIASPETINVGPIKKRKVQQESGLDNDVAFVANTQPVAAQGDMVQPIPAVINTNSVIDFSGDMVQPIPAVINTNSVIDTTNTKVFGTPETDPVSPETINDVENSRSYVDVLYSADYNEIQDALITLKNAVIGSNKQKGSVISQGLLPKLISFITQENVPLNVQLDAAIVIGSLAKGTESHVSALIESRIVDIMLSLITNPNTDKRLVEIALSILRSIFQHPLAPIVEINTNTNFLKDIISLASSDNSIQCQSCVANILVPLCHSFNEQMILCHTGAIPFLARLITTEYSVLQIPALKCLAAMCFTNRTVSDVVCGFTYDDKPLTDILTALLSRVRLSDIQLAAARCLTYIHRSDSLASTDPRIVYRTLPCLARLCTNDFDEETRATAAETLAYLAEIDSELQRLAAISNHLISSLFDLLKSKSSSPRVGAFRCFASLGANDEDIRKRIIETKGLMEEVLVGLGDPCSDVRLAAVRCLHSLSRSVQQLRTTFQDHSVWRPLMTLLQGSPSNELLTVVTSTICNLLLEFSPSKEPMVESGCCELLCELTRSPDAALRLNGSWALMNMAFQAEERIKTKIINTLGTDRVFQLLSDSDSRVIMKTLGLLRNLLSKSMDIESIMSQHSSQLMQAVNLVLDYPHSSEVKEQALCIIGNIALGAVSTDYIMEDESILKKLLEFVTHKDTKLQKAAVIAIKNLIDKNDLNTTQRLMRLNDLGAVDKLEAYLSMTTHLSEDVRSLIRRLVGYT